ncbi:MAG: DNA polymerase III subunit beta [Planctomycetota bacterium]|nr:DNA polymerase III subunit beta [Planctomycetota bacterium]
MNFSVDKQEFSAALSLVCSVIPERSIRLILQNLLLKAESDGITLVGTDLEAGVRITLPGGRVESPGAVLLPAARLNSVVKGSLANELRISVENELAEITTRQGRFQIPGQADTDYPVFPEMGAGGAVFIHGDDFVDAVQKTAFATAKGDTRYALNGIYLDIGEDGLEFVSSDTNRLSHVRKSLRNPEKTAGNGILIPRGMAILAKMAAGRDVLQLKMGANDLLAKTENADMVIHRVEGVFPRYREVIPPPSDFSFTVNREELIATLQNAGAVSSPEFQTVKLALAGDHLNVTAKSDFGEANLNLDAELKGPELELRFNYVYLNEGLKNMRAEKIAVQYTNEKDPVRIEDGDFLYVLMPMDRRN